MEREYHLSIFSANIFYFHFFATDILPHSCFCFDMVVSDIDDYFLLLFALSRPFIKWLHLLNGKKITLTNYEFVSSERSKLILDFLKEKKKKHYLLISPGGASARCKVQEIALMLPEPASATEHRS